MGDDFIEYTVLNETERELLIWLNSPSCEDPVQRGGEFSPTERIPPHGMVDYFYENYADEDFRNGCLRIATTDRRVVYEQRIEYGGEITITEPLTFSSVPFPRQDELPEPPESSWLENAITNITNGTWQEQAFMLSFLALLSGLATVFLTRWQIRKSRT